MTAARWTNEGMRSFLLAWWGVFEGKPVTAKRLADSRAMEFLPGTVIASDRSFGASLRLLAKEPREVGTGRYFIVKRKKGRNDSKPSLWSLQEVFTQVERAAPFVFDEDLTELVGAEWSSFLRDARRVFA